MCDLSIIASSIQLNAPMPIVAAAAAVASSPSGCASVWKETGEKQSGIAIE
jgi:hypothetical protein